MKVERMKIEVGKYYRTFSGHKVRIYAIDGYMDEAIHGALYENCDPAIISLTGWNFEGRKISGEISDLDIVAIWGNENV